MKFNDFNRYFSASRINRYLVATNNSKRKAISLYKHNLKISQSFYPLLGVFEVVFRNSLNEILSEHFSDPNWIINQKNGFMSDPSLKYIYKKTGSSRTNDFLKREVQKIEKKLHKSGKSVTSGIIISEQSLGFWTDLFEVHHYRILKGKPIKIFSKLPSSYGRKEISEHLNKIRRFRNRIYHNEPICFKGNNIDYSTTLEVYESILNLLSWINPELISFTKSIDKVLRYIST